MLGGIICKFISKRVFGGSRATQDSSLHLRQGFEKYLVSGAGYLSWLLIPPHSLCDK